MDSLATNLNRQEMSNDIKNFLLEKFFVNKDDINDDTSFIEQGILTSMNVLELILFVESFFKTEIDILDVSIENFFSIGSICDYVLNKNISEAVC